MICGWCGWLDGMGGIAKQPPPQRLLTERERKREGRDARSWTTGGSFFLFFSELWSLSVCLSVYHMYMYVRIYELVLSWLTCLE